MIYNVLYIHSWHFLEISQANCKVNVVSLELHMHNHSNQFKMSEQLSLAESLPVHQHIHVLHAI